MKSRLIAKYAIDRGTHFEIITRFADNTLKEEISKDKPIAKSIMNIYPTAIWFERKIRDDFGIKFEGAFDNRPLIHHERWQEGIYPMQKEFDKHSSLEMGDYKEYKYERVGGESVFEVAVGPIHAGIIEPGHFQFSQAGEDMLHQEVRHFYKYRGIEKMLEGKRVEEIIPIISRISGNESIAYQIALKQIIFQAKDREYRDSKDAILLEIERIIHHFTDLGFIPNDAGFASALAYCSIRAEDARELLKAISGHRFGFDAVFKDIEIDRDLLSKWIDKTIEDIKWFEDWIQDIPSLWDRLDTTGILSTSTAKKYGAVGVVARSSGIAIDCRDNEYYKDLGFEISLQSKGDVASRFKLRIQEIKNSLTIIKNLLNSSDTLKIEFEGIKDSFYESFVESSIGELYMVIEIKDALIDRFYVRDASFINWQVLHEMMPNNIIADFPLINKSCDLSYAGNDL